MNLWIGLHHHKHGVDTWPFFQGPQEGPLSEDQVVAFIGDDYEGDAGGEWVEIRGPYDVPCARNFPCELPDESEATLNVHATDEGVVFDVWQGDEVVRSGYLFVDDMLALTVSPQGGEEEGE